MDRVSIGSDAAGNASRSRLRTAATLGARLAVPAAVAFSLLIVLLSERAGVEHELRITVPAVVPPGGGIPVRALLYGDLHKPRGPVLLQQPVTVALLDADGRTRARARLRPSAAGDMEGRLELPQGLRGRVAVHAAAQPAGRLVSVRTAVRVEDAPAGPSAQLRPASALQRLAEGPLVQTGEAEAPSAFHLRVVGGACVPEQRCELRVWVGEPAARVRLEAHPSMTRLEDAHAGQGATHGIARLAVVTHGPEAVALLEAVRDGTIVARRRVQLPVALGAAAATLQRVEVPVDADMPRLQLRPHASGFVVDAFRNGRWAGTGSLSAQGGRLPFSLPPGSWRLQARRDPFGGVASAAVRMLYVRPRQQTRVELLREVARHVSARIPDATLATRVAREPARFRHWHLPSLLSYLWAPLEARLQSLPGSVGSYEADVERLRARRLQLRWVALLALAAAGLALVFSLMRRGLEASAQARRILGDAGDPDAHSRRTRWRMTLTVVSSALALLLAFVAIGLYLSARSLATPF